jgi:hypothetical protein
MTRIRKRTTQNAAWKADNLEMVIICVKEHVKSVHRVAKESEMPYITCEGRLQHGLVPTPKIVRKLLFSEENNKLS